MLPFKNPVDEHGRHAFQSQRCAAKVTSDDSQMVIEVTSTSVSDLTSAQFACLRSQSRPQHKCLRYGFRLDELVAAGSLAEDQSMIDRALQRLNQDSSGSAAVQQPSAPATDDMALLVHILVSRRSVGQAPLLHRMEHRCHCADDSWFVICACFFSEVLLSGWC